MQTNMTAIRRATKIIESNPYDQQAFAVADVVYALEHEAPLPLSKFHHMDLRILSLLLEIVDEWKLARHEVQRKHLLSLLQKFEDYRSNNDFT